MRDRVKIVTGLVLFVAVVLIPFFSALGIESTARPKPKLVTEEKSCVMGADAMRAQHMDLLDEWRTAVVREGRRTTVDESGRTVTMSLSGTCMSCHPNKQEFCDTCHDYLAVTPYCWSCHVEPPRRSS